MATKEIAVRKMVAPATVSSGTAVYIGDLDPATVSFSLTGTFSATYKFFVSQDGTNWTEQVGADVTANAIKNMTTDGTNASQGARYARVTCSAHSSGAALSACVTGMPLTA